MVETKSNWKLILLRFFAWVAAGVGVFLNIFLIREAVLDLVTWWAVREAEAYQARGEIAPVRLGFITESVDRFLIIFMAVLSVALIVWIEYYFRIGQRKGQLYRRISIVLGSLVGVGLLSWLITIII
jgi:hypothetical protein